MSLLAISVLNGFGINVAFVLKKGPTAMPTTKQITAASTVVSGPLPPPPNETRFFFFSGSGGSGGCLTAPRPVSGERSGAGVPPGSKAPPGPKAPSSNPGCSGATAAPPRGGRSPPNIGVSMACVGAGVSNAGVKPPPPPPPNALSNMGVSMSESGPGPISGVSGEKSLSAAGSWKPLPGRALGAGVSKAGDSKSVGPISKPTGAGFTFPPVGAGVSTERSLSGGSPPDTPFPAPEPADASGGNGISDCKLSESKSLRGGRFPKPLSSSFGIDLSAFPEPLRSFSLAMRSTSNRQQKRLELLNSRPDDLKREFSPRSGRNATTATSRFQVCFARLSLSFHSSTCPISCQE